MMITIEISYYPLSKEMLKPINKFIDLLKNDEIKVETGVMSTIITGEYDIVMKILNDAMKALMEKYPSVFNIKISNACLI